MLHPIFLKNSSASPFSVFKTCLHIGRTLEACEGDSIQVGLKILQLGGHQRRIGRPGLSPALTALMLSFPSKCLQRRRRAAGCEPRGHKKMAQTLDVSCSVLKALSKLTQLMRKTIEVRPHSGCKLARAGALSFQPMPKIIVQPGQSLI